MSQRLVAEASGILKVWVEVAEEILKSVPVVPTAKVWLAVVRVLRVLIQAPAGNVVQAQPLFLNWIVQALSRNQYPVVQSVSEKLI
jgi:hypothetical protein